MWVRCSEVRLTTGWFEQKGLKRVSRLGLIVE